MLNCQQNHTCEEAVTETQPQTQILQETQVGLKIKQMCEATKLLLIQSFQRGLFSNKVSQIKIQLYSQYILLGNQSLIKF